MKGAAIITGAQRGIGKAIALALAAEGYDVAAVDLELTEDLYAVVHEAKTKGVKAVALACNIGDVTAHDGTLEAAEKSFGAAHNPHQQRGRFSEGTWRSIGRNARSLRSLS